MSGDFMKSEKPRGLGVFSFFSLKDVGRIFMKEKRLRMQSKSINRGISPCCLRDSAADCLPAAFSRRVNHRLSF